MLSGWGRSHRGSVRPGVLAALVLAFAVAGVLVWPGLAAHRSLASSEVAARSPGPDATSLARLGEQAKQLAREMAAEPALRQVDVDPVSGRTSFYFTDAPATVEINVLLPSPSAPADQWQRLQPPAAASKFVGHARPGLDLQVLRVDPTDALRPLAAHWTGCAPRSLTLYGERDALTWYAACTLTDGRVAVGTVDGRTGTFQPSPAPPAPPPPTAAPSR